jgi:hypothetical protein
MIERGILPEGTELRPLNPMPEGTTSPADIGARGRQSGGRGVLTGLRERGWFAAGRRFGCAAQVAEESADPQDSADVPRPGCDRKVPAASPCAIASIDELADTGRVEVVELVEYDDNGCAGALLGQQRLAEIAMGCQVEFAAEDQPGCAVRFAAPLDAEVRFAAEAT